MNIYHFVYAYFYYKIDYPKLGRIYGSAHVFLALLSHFLFLTQIINCIVDYNFVSFLFSGRVNGLLSHRKQVYFMYCLPFFIISWFFYNKKRTERILEKFNNRDEYVIQGDTNRIILYIVGPFLAALFLVFLKQKGVL